MKSFLSLLVVLTAALSFAHAAPAPVITWATLQNGDDRISTPKTDQSNATETIRRSTLTLDGETCTLALKSSVFARDGGYAYSVAVSLSATKEDHFGAAESGTMKTLQPIKFIVTRGTRQYPVTVYFRSKDA